MTKYLADFVSGKEYTQVFDTEEELFQYVLYSARAQYSDEYCDLVTFWLAVTDDAERGYYHWTERPFNMEEWRQFPEWFARGFAAVDCPMKFQPKWRDTAGSGFHYVGDEYWEISGLGIRPTRMNPVHPDYEKEV